VYTGIQPRRLATSTYPLRRLRSNMPAAAMPKVCNTTRCSETLQKESDRTISRDQFLAGRIQAMKLQPSESYRLRSMTAADLALSQQPSLPSSLAPPPGLEHLGPMSITEKASVAIPEEPAKEIAPEVPAPEPEVYKVLLQNLPAAMLKECMLRAMLEQAKLLDIGELKYRPNGKVLISFSSYASAYYCINHFQGRQWGDSPIKALYVRTVKSVEGPAADKPQQPLLAKPMSADAPVFVPKAAAKLSADAPTFVPSSAKEVRDVQDGERERCYSNASTEAGPLSDEASDGFESETEVGAVCT